jgi:hypothetical protein
MKPRVFIASSKQGLGVAYAGQECIEYDLEPTVWPQGGFEIGKTALESLDAQAHRFDAAIFVFGPDDKLVTASGERDAVRDNVVFELGLFIGRLGRDKCFIIKPRSFPDSHFPSDLLGVVPATFDDARSDNNLQAAVGPACNKIQTALLARPDLKPASTTPQPPSDPTNTVSFVITPVEAALFSQPWRLIYNAPRSKRIVFAPGGQIVEGNNQNEHSWRVVGDRLELLQLDGKVHSRFVLENNGTFRHTNDKDTLSLRNQLIVPDNPKAAKRG